MSLNFTKKASMKVLLFVAMNSHSSKAARAGDFKINFLHDFDDYTFTMVSVGDSITRAFNAYHYFADAPQYSWSTGEVDQNDFKSHQHRFLDKVPNMKIRSFNFAKTGASVNTLERNVKEAADHKPDYVTYMVGSNDVCSWTEDKSENILNFREKVRSHISHLIASNPLTKIVMMPIPDIYHLWKINSVYTSCRTYWDFTGICAPLLSSWRTQEDRDRFRLRWVEANKALEDVASEFYQQVKYPSNLADYEFSPQHVSSYDCFHPSIVGQNLLSELSWENGWFREEEVD